MKFAIAAIFAAIAAAAETESFHGYNGARSNGPSGIYNTARYNGPAEGYNSARSNGPSDGYNSARSNGPSDGYSSARSNGPASIYNTARSNGPSGIYNTPRSNQPSFGVPEFKAPQFGGFSAGGIGSFNGLNSFDAGDSLKFGDNGLKGFDARSSLPKLETSFRGQGPKVEGFRGQGPKELKGFRGHGPKAHGLKGFDAGKGIGELDFSHNFKQEQHQPHKPKFDTRERGGVRDFGDIKGIKGLDKNEGGDAKDLGGIGGRGNIKTDSEIGGLDGLNGIDGQNQSIACKTGCGDTRFYSDAPCVHGPHQKNSYHNYGSHQGYGAVNKKHHSSNGHKA